MNCPQRLLLRHYSKSKGLLQNREKLIISTREPVIRRESSDEGIVTDTTTRQTSESSWINPTKVFLC